MRDSEELEQLLGDLVHANSHLVRVAARQAGGAESPALWRTLGVLGNDRALRVGELARLSRVTQPTMTKLVAGLTDRGWVTQSADEEDARATRISATPKGRAALDAWRSELARALRPYFLDLTDEEFDALRRTVLLLRQRVASSDSVPTGPSITPILEQGVDTPNGA